ncbi:hypothetical protein MNQ95_15185 [Pseudoxanthomonas daejeonensis]|uniref:hypothetical protein n=1 Tax=Pseudoxanthomonas daejeonensis TaxID=266062 RepID=UPI001F546038|nr:hypothetical protein [Pseudoxanthomonas daejeonensis]UNK57448.1 hypothetical protein MNQ95_15185 [Pseudoxanthomonas daejeonensis]
MQAPHDTAQMASLYVHIRIVLGMIVGLGLTHLLRHFANLIENPKRKRIYWVHLGWALSMFLFLIHFWWWQFRLGHLVEWNFNLYLFVTLYALLLYLLCALVFSDSASEYPDYREYFYARRQWFFGLLALAYAVDMVDTWIKGPAYFHSFGNEFLVRNLAYIVLCGIAMLTRSPRFHGAFVSLGLAYQAAWIARQFETL